MIWLLKIVRGVLELLMTDGVLFFWMKDTLV